MSGTWTYEVTGTIQSVQRLATNKRFPERGGKWTIVLEPQGWTLPDGATAPSQPLSVTANQAVVKAYGAAPEVGDVVVLEGRASGLSPMNSVATALSAAEVPTER